MGTFLQIQKRKKELTRVTDHDLYTDEKNEWSAIQLAIGGEKKEHTVPVAFN
jgi:hypothetical protein